MNSELCGESLQVVLRELPGEPGTSRRGRDRSPAWRALPRSPAQESPVRGRAAVTNIPTSIDMDRQLLAHVVTPLPNGTLAVWDTSGFPKSSSLDAGQPGSIKKIESYIQYHAIVF